MPSKAKLLVVDDDPSVSEVLCEGLRIAGYDCETANNGEEALERFKENNFQVVLSDINMPGQNGIDLLHAVKKINEDVDVVMVTGVINTDMAVHSMSIGASDYITKPFNFEEVRIVVEKTLKKRELIIENREYQQSLERKVKERTVELLNKKKEVERLYNKISSAFLQIQETYSMTLEALASALDIRDRETLGHSKRVVEYCLLMAEAMNIKDQQLLDIRNGALLHDVGKIGIPDAILIKPGRLSESEWNIMKKHPIFGYRILSGIKFLEGALPIVLHHHEKWNGSGYPHGMKKEAIPLSARIFAIADAFDAMTSARSYRDTFTYAEAINDIKRHSGFQFDPDISDIFLSIPEQRWEDISKRIADEIRFKRFLEDFPSLSFSTVE